MEHTFEELKDRTCHGFGGNNCILHGCMFSCQLHDARIESLKKEKNMTKEEAEKFLQSANLSH